MAKNCSIKRTIWLYIILSGILLSVPYLLPHCGFIMLFAFIPLFLAENISREYKIKGLFFKVYISFLIWNLLTTFWVYFATAPGSFAAFILNSLQMALIFGAFMWFRGFLKGILPYIFFMVAFLAWEHSYYTWQVSWPWLVLGNSFAATTKWIQWYQFTGTLGGSFWILLSNILLFRIIILYKKQEPYIKSLIAYIVVLLAPITASFYLYYSYPDSNTLCNREKNYTNVAIIQPNIDPYGEKFSGMTQEQQNVKFLSLIERAIEERVDDKPILAIGPETFISPTSWNSLFYESNPNGNRTLVSIADNLKRKEVSIDLLLGAVTEGKDERYNSAIFLPAESAVEEVEFYHKSKLVILAESNPFISGPFKFMDKLVSDIAGGIGNFGTQKSRSLFSSKNTPEFGSAICYESIYGDFYREWVLNGAKFMTIITNDGWWRDTPGHLQHLNYARLRAIETRRDIARCANTGVSAIINSRGDIISKTDWWKDSYIMGRVNHNSYITPFVKYGDIIGRVSRFLLLLFILMGIAKRFSKNV